MSSASSPLAARSDGSGQTGAKRDLRIGMVAGEPSGDLLAARIIQGLRQGNSGVQVEGIGGPEMAAQQFHQYYPMDALTVFGYVEALKRIPGLVSTYLGMRNQWLRQRPDVFVGIDAPDFNLRLEHRLRQAGVPTVHFVGPSIWAWRYERIHKIREAVSHMLVLFPFETEIYEKEGIAVTYVGHPLAANIPVQPDKVDARRRLGLPETGRILGVLPGSRSSEVKMLSPRFLQAVQILQDQEPDLTILVPMVNPKRRQEFEAALAEHPVRNLHIIDANTAGIGVPDSQGVVRPPAWTVMEASDAVLVASGTASLETALYKRPMVISYVLSPMMERIIRWKSGQDRPYVPWVGLPNVLARDFVVPELLQEDAQPAKLAQACWKALSDQSYVAHIEQVFTEMHLTLRRDTPALAAEVILNMARA